MAFRINKDENKKRLKELEKKDKQLKKLEKRKRNGKWNNARRVFSDLKAEGKFKAFNEYIDFSLLDPRTTKEDIDELLSVAHKNKYYSVIVPPSFVSYSRSVIDNQYNGEIVLGSVVGFPLGVSLDKTKIQEAKTLKKLGADEIEVSINLSSVKSGDFNAVRSCMSKIVRKCRKRVVKAIIETAYLSETEIEKLVKVLIRAKVDYVMTSSGYAPLGSTVELIEKLSSFSANRIGIKASGGIKTRLDAESFIRLGATRIGTSRIL